MPKRVRHHALYVRVSSGSQDLASQEPDLTRWALAQGGPAVWYRDKETGTKMDRPGWHELAEALRVGLVETVVVWRVDRLGRTASGLTALFDTLVAWKVNLISLRDGLDLSTPAGRLMAGVLASVAQYETEVRGERQRAGIAAAKARGVYSGRKRGTPKADAGRAAELRAKGLTLGEIAASLRVNERTVRRYLA